MLNPHKKLLTRWAVVDRLNVIGWLWPCEDDVMWFEALTLRSLLLIEALRGLELAAGARCGAGQA